jgi:hypothetical protein
VAWVIGSPVTKGRGWEINKEQGDVDQDQFLAEANQHLGRLKQLTSEIGLQHVDIPPASFGVGFGVAFSATDFVVVSIGAASTNNPYITAGALRDINRNTKLAALEVCNTMNADGKGVTVFLHDADAGWDVLAQTNLPIQLLFDVPPYYAALLRGLPQSAQEARQKLNEVGITGESYRWDNLDSQRLLLRSLI